MDRHDPLAPTAAADVDVDTDSGIEVESSGIDLSYTRETDDGSPTPERVQHESRPASPPAIAAKTPATPPDGGEHGDAGDDDEADADQRARDERGRFAKADAPPEPSKSLNRGEKRVQTIRAKIDAETRALTTARQAREAEERELARIRQEKEALTGKPAAANPKTAAQAESQLGPKPSWKDFEAEGKDYSEFEAARDEWLLKQAEANVLTKLEAQRADEKAAAEKEKTEAAARTRQDAQAKRFDEARAKFTDFDTVIQAATDAGLDIHDYAGVVIDESRLGAELLYEMSKQPDLADTVSAFLDTLTENASYPLVEALIDSDAPARLFFALADPKVQTEVTQTLRTKQGRAALTALVRLDERLAARATGSQRPPAPGSQAAPPPSHRAGSHSAGVSRSSGDSETVEQYTARRQREVLEARRSA